MSGRRRAKLGGALCVMLALVAWAHAAGAQTPSKIECAAAFEDAQVLRQQSKLVAARAKLVFCSHPSCPVAAKSPCARWRQEVEAAIATVIFAVKDADGADVPDVRIFSDGALLAEQPGRQPVEIDPGRHVMTFESGRAGRAEKTVAIAPQSRGAVVEVRLGRSPVVASGEEALEIVFDGVGDVYVDATFAGGVRPDQPLRVKSPGRGAHVVKVVNEEGEFEEHVYLVSGTERKIAVYGPRTRKFGVKHKGVHFGMSVGVTVPFYSVAGHGLFQRERAGGGARVDGIVNIGVTHWLDFRTGLRAQPAGMSGFFMPLVIPATFVFHPTAYWGIRLGTAVGAGFCDCPNHPQTAYPYSPETESDKQAVRFWVGGEWSILSFRFGGDGNHELAFDQSFATMPGSSDTALVVLYLQSLTYGYLFL